MSDVAFRSATELVQALKAKEVSSRELLEIYLARIERLNPSINAVVTLDAERALHAAQVADRALARGEDFGPLHGLPMTVKDALETAGMRTTSGAPELAEHIPEADAVAVGRLRRAGAVIFGKTNLPLYAGDCQTYNEVFGTTNNPWDLNRGPGGSSGGSAAALAAGLTGFELGSDIGGSIRNPAHFCGVYGLKPTYGLVPLRGHIPGPPGSLLEPDVGVVGPMGRAVDDLALGLDVLVGPEDDRARAWTLALPGPRHGSLAEYRVAAWLDDPACPVDGQVLEVLAGAADGLRDAGAKIDDRARPGFTLSEAAGIWEQIVGGIMSLGIPEAVFQMACQAAEVPRQPDEPWLMRSARMAAQRLREFVPACEHRERLRAAWVDFFRDYDVLLCPVTATAAFPHDHSDRVMGERTLTVNDQAAPYWNANCWWAGMIGVCLLPSVVVPLGLNRSGLPVGVQIVGPYLEDRTALDVAARISEVLGGFQAPPGY